MTIIGLKTNKLLNYLDEILPNAKCELNYSKDYELLIAVMLSAQTNDKRVNEVTNVLFKKYSNLESLNKAKIDDLKDIIYSLGNWSIKSKNIKNIVSKLVDLGYVPNDREFLESLPGVGRKTANVVLSNLYNEQCIAVDTHVERVAKRLKLATKKDNALMVEKKLTRLIPKEKLSNVHHQLVLFGRYYCKAKNPICSTCKLQEICEYYKKTN